MTTSSELPRPDPVELERLVSEGLVEVEMVSDPTVMTIRSYTNRTLFLPLTEGGCASIEPGGLLLVQGPAYWLG